MKDRMLKFFISQAISIALKLYDEFGKEKLSTIFADAIVIMDRKLDKSVGYINSNIIKEELSEILEEQAELLAMDALKEDDSRLI